MRLRDGPLQGVLVLDLSLLLPGPFCAQLLGDLGASVISVEPPAGDYTRHTAGQVHATVNRNKRSVVFDLKDPDQQRQCLELAGQADVVLEGFRPGVAERLGVGYRQVLEVNSRAVYCSLSGFGQDGPWQSRPGHELSYLCLSGALSFSGHWGESPKRQGVPMGDAGASVYAALSIVTALYDRQRTGTGCYLDVSILDTATAFAALRGGPRLDLDPDDQLHLFPQNDLFVAADGISIAVCAIEPHFWDRLRRCLGRYDARLLESRFDDESGRRAHGDELNATIREIIARQPADTWITELSAHDVPAERLLTLEAALDTPQARSRGLVTEVGGQRHVRFPVLKDGLPMGDVRSVAPELGVHTDEVLREFGIRRSPDRHPTTAR